MRSKMQEARCKRQVVKGKVVFVLVCLFLASDFLLLPFDFMDDMLINDGQTLYNASITDTRGETKFGTFPQGMGIKTPGTAFTIKGALTPGGLPRTYSYIPAEEVASVFKRGAEAEKQKGTGAGIEQFYSFVSAGLDTSASRWYDDKVYLLVVRSQIKSIISILPYNLSFYESIVSARNGFENRFRKSGEQDIICWGQSIQIANPRAYFFLEPQKRAALYKVFIQKEVNGKVSEPILYTFRREAGQDSPTTAGEYRVGIGRVAPLPSNRMRLR
ncbi:MAG: hypothetical protein AB1393_09495 [Candidatus Edwardsbacteria bacterium]